MWKNADLCLAHAEAKKNHHFLSFFFKFSFYHLHVVILKDFYFERLLIETEKKAHFNSQ